MNRRAIRHGRCRACRSRARGICAGSSGPSWGQFKPAAGSLKEKMHTGQPIRSAAATVDATRAQLQEMSKKVGGAELFSLDAQHRPLPDERDLVKFCKMAEELGAGVQIRLQHPKLAYLTGRYADLGVLAVMVPLVEDVETVNEAIDNFYYPPLGNRSWGGEFRFRETPPTDRLEYAQWWNGHALLGFQIETLRGALNARKHRQARHRLDFLGARGHGVRYREALEQPLQDGRGGPQYVKGS